MAMWQWKMLSQTFTSLGFPRAILANLPVKVVVDPDRVNSANNIIDLHDFAPKCFLLVSGSITAIIARDIVCGLKHLIGKTCQWSSKKQSKANQWPKTWIGWQRKCKEKWSGPSCLQPVFWRKNIIDVFPPEFWLKQESGRWPQVKTLAARSVNIVSLAESAGSNGFLTPSFTNLRISVIHLLWALPSTSQDFNLALVHQLGGNALSIRMVLAAAVEVARQQRQLHRAHRQPEGTPTGEEVLLATYCQRRACRIWLPEHTADNFPKH